jgi:hypothetical protein
LFGWPFGIAAGLQIVCKKRGPPHLERCPLCDQEEEMVRHILTSCVFARQFWFAILQPLNLANLTPTSSASSFAEWWKRSEKRLQKQHRKGFNSLCILGAWILWKHRNACVFDGLAPNLQIAIQVFKDESQLWQFSGSRGLLPFFLNAMIRSSPVYSRKKKGLTALCLEMGAMQA